MPYDPNDPNQDSQAPSYEGDPYKGGLSLDALVKSRPQVQAFLAAHNGGKNLSEADKAQLFSIIQSTGMDTKMLEIDDEGNFNAGTGHALQDIAYGSLLAFGPVLASWALPLVAGSGAAASEGSLASLGGSTGAAATDVGLGAAAPVLGPATAGSMAATDAIVAGGAVPASLASAGVPSAVSATIPAATYGASGAVTNFANAAPEVASGIGSTLAKIASSSWFPTALGVAGNLAGAAIQANQSDKAIDAQSAASKEALDFAKSQAALERQNFAPYLAAGTGALSKLSFGLGIGAPGDYDATGNVATPPGGSPGSITPAGDPIVSPKSPAANFIASTRTQPVWMTAPTGERQQVPADKVQHYLNLGAKLDPGQGMSGGSLSTLGRTPPPGSETIGTATARV